MGNLPGLKDKEYPLLIDPVRELLEATKRPWVIENVMGAHLPAGWLCGIMFGLPFYRHRAFETNWFWMQPGHGRHVKQQWNESDKWSDVHTFSHAEDNRGIESWPNRRSEPAGLMLVRNGAQKVGVADGHAAGWRLAADAMGIDWMKREELTQAIPPAYTEYIGMHLLRML